MLHIQANSFHEPDFIDRASIETNRSLEVTTRSREQHFLFKIEQALERINCGIYGFCEGTGAPIGFARLDAYPMTTLCLEAKEIFQKTDNNHYKKKKNIVRYIFGTFAKNKSFSNKVKTI